MLSPFRWLELHPVKGSLFGAYLVAAYFLMRDGIFYDRERLFPLMFVGLAILAIGSGWRRLLELILYWVPFFLLWVAYDLIRGQADNGRAIYTTEPIAIEKALFLGRVPSNVLQDRLYVPSEVQWWETITGLTYMTHFFFVYSAAAVLFIRSKERFLRWMTALVLLTVLGLLGYWLFPMAPPWMAADNLGLLPDLARPGTRGLRLLHLSFADRLWTHGKNNVQMVNPVAAMPSLHAGYSMLFSWFFLKRAAARLDQGTAGALPAAHGLHPGLRRRALRDRHPGRLAARHLRRRSQRPFPRSPRAASARSSATCSSR